MTSYIINGIGRCGTTLLYHFLVKYYGATPFIVNIEEVEKYPQNKNYVFKTHCPYALDSHKGNVKVVFMYGNIYNTVLSYKAKDVWCQQAVKHMHLDPANYKKDHFEEDIYNFKRYFTNWNKPHKYPVMLIKYENMYKHLGEILSFCGLSKSVVPAFPAQKERKTDWQNLPQEQQDKLIKIYGSTQEIVDSLPDIKIV